MKKTFITLLTFILFFGSIKMFAASAKFELKTSNATLVINNQGELKIILNTSQSILVNTSINQLWNITLKNNSNRQEYKQPDDIRCDISRLGDKLQISVGEHENNHLKANFYIAVKDDAFCFSGLVKSNSEEWTIKELEYPVFSEIMIRNEPAKIYWPEGLGKFYDDPKSFGNNSLWYPAGKGAAMPWFSVNSSDAGVYVGSHDPVQGTKIFNLAYSEMNKAFKASTFFPVYCDKFDIPDVMIKLYKGEWYQASKFYRNWYDKHFEPFSGPDWVINDSGWLLAILKQQNCEVMWPYSDLDKLCDVAERYNLSTIGLFGWAVGGHDHLYPNYPPDNLMGGKKALEEAIERAHKRGIKIVLYANGKIMDTATDFYKFNGYETIIIQENSRPDIQFYVKQKNASPVIFAQACTGSELWRKTMFDLGMQAVSLGADGILYDQLGVLPPVLCFSQNHDHQPGQADPIFRLQMVEEINKKAKELNPDFIVMTEATDDLMLRGIDYTHGWGAGLAPGENVFPELYRYTFPELVTTQRNPNPMITRTDANYALIYGLRHEVETRYPGDVKYLNEGSFTPEDYANVVSPPSFSKMNSAPAAEAEKYVYGLIRFEKLNSEFFRKGNFIAREGISVVGEDIVAQGFTNGRRMGVVVWNKNEESKRKYSVTVEGYELKDVKELGNDNVDISSELNPNSIRLLVYEKK